MKTLFFVVLGLVAVSAVPVEHSFPQFENGTPKMKEQVNTCLRNYKIDPAVLELGDEKNFEKTDKLTKLEWGCVRACVYKGANFMRADGSLDMEVLTDGDEPEDKKKFESVVDICRAEAGKDDCKFFQCMDEKDDS
ncbi:hypothetical protein TSAR_003829 [Trichomalopsis sarcophagae]|uniref:Uncharacterized protein n=1 Tax=Trichomalopsis sarcophagae TaxID=543379 RepID=A0A232FGR3_9HYME|nr:hypothetical protein TSAR_003829 [Trichomalopsis sarcophagae]